MTTLTVNINDKKTEKAVKAVLDALGLDYRVKKDVAEFIAAEDEVLYKRLQKSAKEIKQFKEGKINLQNAADFLNEL